MTYTNENRLTRLPCAVAIVELDTSTLRNVLTTIPGENLMAAVNSTELEEGDRFELYRNLSEGRPYTIYGANSITECFVIGRDDCPTQWVRSQSANHKYCMKPHEQSPPFSPPEYYSIQVCVEEDGGLVGCEIATGPSILKALESITDWRKPADMNAAAAALESGARHTCGQVELVPLGTGYKEWGPYSEPYRIGIDKPWEIPPDNLPWHSKLCGVTAFKDGLSVAFGSGTGLQEATESALSQLRSNTGVEINAHRWLDTLKLQRSAIVYVGKDSIYLNATELS